MFYRCMAAATVGLPCDDGRDLMLCPEHADWARKQVADLADHAMSMGWPDATAEAARLQIRMRRIS